MTISVPFVLEEKDNLYYVAVELIKVVGHQAVLQLPRRLGRKEALAFITLSLAQSSRDDELELLDQHVSIDLVDPFMSKIFNIPARGKNCIHRECFDLEEFLRGRASRFSRGSSDPDKWRCPICKKDARPSELVVNEFLLEVRGKLREDNMLETRAILITADGTWEVKAEKKPESRKQSRTGNLLNQRNCFSCSALVCARYHRN